MAIYSIFRHNASSPLSIDFVPGLKMLRGAWSFLYHTMILQRVFDRHFNRGEISRYCIPEAIFYRTLYVLCERILKVI